MRTGLFTTVVALSVVGCSSNVTQGLTNGGPPRHHVDAGNGTSGGLALGDPCTSNTACNSQRCGLSGFGNCCAEACPSTTSVCAAAGCDDAGSCAYAPGATPCGSQVCVGDVMTGPTCDGFGNCSAKTVVKCPGNFLCNDAGSDCNGACTSSADCDTGTFCNHGLCAPPVTAGPCSESDNCVSKLCGLDGGAGHCCNHLCAPGADSSCAATDCDDLGECAYVDAGVVCVAAGCVGSFIEAARFCDGAGTCDSSSSFDCSPYACATASSCSTTCSDSQGCAPESYCDALSGACCGLGNAGTLYVDNVLGDDSAACCGQAHATPCRTLTHAMQVIDAAQAQHVTIDASDSAQAWDMDAEEIPLRLGWGTELSIGQNVYFGGATDGGATALFEIGKYSANDSIGTASLIGGHLGETSTTLPAPDSATILVDPGATLFITQSNVFSSRVYQTTAIEVSAGGSLVLGGDQAEKTYGQVVISAAQGGGYNGIVCGSHAGLGCTITDVDGLNTGSIRIQGQSNVDLDAEDFSSITLSNSPIIGTTLPSPDGYDTCVSKADTAQAGAAVLLHGRASVTFEGGVVACIAGTAFGLTASANGVPTLALLEATVANSDCALHAWAGSAVVVGTTLQFNYNGVIQDTDGTNLAGVELGITDGGVGNTIICNDFVESSQGASLPGVAVLNTTTATLDAQGVTWDTTGPDTFSCDPGLSACVCDLSSCTLAPGDDGMDAVSVSTGAVVTIGSLWSNVTCGLCNNVACPGAQACCSGSCC